MKSTLVKKKIGDKTYISFKEERKVKIITEEHYRTNGESLIIVKEIPFCNLYLNSLTTTSVIIKAMTKVNILPENSLIDELYEDVIIENGASIVLEFVSGVWYITSSDGLKLD